MELLFRKKTITRKVHHQTDHVLIYYKTFCNKKTVFFCMFRTLRVIFYFSTLKIV